MAAKSELHIKPAKSLLDANIENDESEMVQPVKKKLAALRSTPKPKV